jgi:leucyl/phenylalanyl-tRNA---protein transferase
MAKAHPEQNRLYWVKDNIIANDFPDIRRALQEPDGLLAIGGDLSPERLLNAYARGIFPWNNEGQPVLWWSPDPRWVLLPENIKVARSLGKILKSGKFRVTFNQDFPAVISMCAAPRRDEESTWITNSIITNFSELHRLGYAHSVESRLEGKLVGGLYGIAMGKIFFGESMFSKASNASKVALVQLARLLSASGFKLIDCQVYTRHLESMGAIPMPRNSYAQALKDYCNPHDKLVLPGALK